MSLAEPLPRAPEAPENRHQQLAHLTGSFGIAAFLFTALAGSLSLWNNEFLDLFPASRYSILFAGSFLLLSAALLKFKFREFRLDERGFALGLLMMFLTDWPNRSYNLLQGPFIRGEIILAGLITFWILRSNKLSFLRFALPLTIVLLASCFFIEAHGRILSSDDNPTFLYRLTLLKQNFPFIPFYNPLWNAGIESRDFFATGSLNIFFVFAPIIYAFDVASVYNIIIALLLFGFVPLSIFLAARIIGARSPATFFAALLALTGSLLWYRWALKYGTLGFITSASLIPLNVALLARLLADVSPVRKKDFILTLVTFTLMLFWTPSGLVFIPAALLALSRVTLLWKKPRLAKLVATMFVLNLPWILLFWRVSNVGTFLKTEKPSYSSLAEDSTTAYTQPKPTEHINTKPRVSSFNAKASLKMLRENSVSTNPLLVLLAIPGLFLLPKAVRLLFVGTVAWLIFLGTVGAQLKPQLELERMLLICTLCLCPATAVVIERIFRAIPGAEFSKLNFISAVTVGGYLFAAPFSTASVLFNRSIEHFYFAAPNFGSIVDTIQKYTGDGRALFSGFVLHDLYHGHLAPLPLVTGKPLVASSPFHDQWKYKEIFPPAVLAAGDAGIDNYLNLMNATVVFAHEEPWQNYFTAHPERFERVADDDRFWAFRRVGYESTYFLEGSGKILAQDSNALTLSLSSPEATIKFAYLDFLSSSACKIEPVEPAYGLRFIRLSGCPLGEPITIRALGPFDRVLKGHL
jgi:hypothetical protein